MYEDVMRVIESGNYELVDMLHRIDVLYADAKLTDEEREQLVSMAREKSRPVVDDYEKSIIELTVRVQSLEDRVDAVEGKAADEYPDYAEGRIYRHGDQVTFSGKRYKMILPGEVMASPTVYPDAWEYVEDAPAEAGEPEQGGEE